MAANRKLQAEIDRCLKKVTEGVEKFEEIWMKVQNASNTNQKEKYEEDLKKEIKKLQRLRDQIKTWITSGNINDKSVLMEKRKLIELQMERFKVVERETKTKAYSKEGLTSGIKIDPHEKERSEITNWLNQCIDSLKIQIDQFEAELETLTTTKKKKGRGGANEINEQKENIQGWIERHSSHVERLEIILRMVDNDTINLDQVKNIQEDIEYYIENCQEPDFAENELIYEDIDGFEDILSDLSNSNVNSYREKNSSNDHNYVSEACETMSTNSANSPVPFSSSSTHNHSNENDAKKRHKSSSEEGKSGSSKSSSTTPKLQTQHSLPGQSSGTEVNNSSNHSSTSTTAASSSASLISAAVNSNQQQHFTSEESSQSRTTTTSSTNNSSPIAGMNHTGVVKPGVQNFAAAVQQPNGHATPLSENSANGLNHSHSSTLSNNNMTFSASASVNLKNQVTDSAEVLPLKSIAQEALAIHQEQQPQPHLQEINSSSAAPLSHSQVVGGGLFPKDERPSNLTTANNQPQLNTNQQPVQNEAHIPPLLGVAPLGPVPLNKETRFQFEMLEAASQHMPHPSDSEKLRPYLPRNPCATPTYYPQLPPAGADNIEFFQRLSTETLFFIFYYMEGTKAQYLAAKALKTQSWRFHTRYMMWFQRHEEPKIISEEYEQGTYIYFDYEKWGQRKKDGFTFEYRFLEDRDLS